MVDLILLLFSLMFESPLLTFSTLLFLMLLFGLYKIFTGIGFRMSNENEDGNRQWEFWIDNRQQEQKPKKDQKKEPTDTE